MEQKFISLFKPFLDLERNTSQNYSDKEYNLNRMPLLAALAGNPEKILKIIHIAGTKGKGSTAILLGSLLNAGENSCGVFSSPHLISIRERFLVNNQPLPYKILIEEADKLINKIQKKTANVNFFEIMTVLALRLFVRLKCRYAVVETGIGGLLDATNYIPSPECCIITAVSFDHTELLGRGLPEIAAQKAGIIKKNTPLIVSRQPFEKEVMPIITKEANKKTAPLYRTNPENNAGFPSWETMPPVQRENFASALQATRILNLMPKPSEFQTPQLPGRCQVLKDKPLIIVDGAHNGDSARRLTETIKWFYPNSRFLIIIGVAQGKDCEEILLNFTQLKKSHFILTNPRPFKKSGLGELTTAAEKLKLRYKVIPEINSRTQLPDNENLLFTGSFFTAVIGAELWGVEEKKWGRTR